MKPTVAVDAGRLPGQIHGDPADRMIIATARHLACPRSHHRSAKILSYAEQGHLRKPPTRAANPLIRTPRADTSRGAGARSTPSPRRNSQKRAPFVFDLEIIADRLASPAASTIRHRFVRGRRRGGRHGARPRQVKRRGGRREQGDHLVDRFGTREQMHRARPVCGHPRLYRAARPGAGFVRGRRSRPRSAGTAGASRGGRRAGRSAGRDRATSSPQRAGNRPWSERLERVRDEPHRLDAEAGFDRLDLRAQQRSR